MLRMAKHYPGPCLMIGPTTSTQKGRIMAPSSTPSVKDVLRGVVAMGIAAVEGIATELEHICRPTPTPLTASTPLILIRHPLVKTRPPPAHHLIRDSSQCLTVNRIEGEAASGPTRVKVPAGTAVVLLLPPKLHKPMSSRLLRTHTYTARSSTLLGR